MGIRRTCANAAGCPRRKHSSGKAGCVPVNQRPTEMGGLSLLLCCCFALRCLTASLFRAGRAHSPLRAALHHRLLRCGTRGRRCLGPHLPQQSTVSKVSRGSARACRFERPRLPRLWPALPCCSSVCVVVLQSSPSCSQSCDSSDLRAPTLSGVQSTAGIPGHRGVSEVGPGTEKAALAGSCGHLPGLLARSSLGHRAQG